MDLTHACALSVEPGMYPLLVRAHLSIGIAHPTPWGIALDGLLASQMWTRAKRRRLGRGLATPRLGDIETPADLDLPLARCHLGDSWHWAATCAQPSHPVDLPDVHYSIGRLDARHAERTAAELPRHISERQGRYRARRMPLLVTGCVEVQWRAVGHPAHVRELLANVPAIGKKRTAGEGHVLTWRITPTDDDPWDAAHLHADRSLGRPTPPECLRGRTTVIDGGETVAGIRPPYFHPSRQQTLRVPKGWDQ